MRCFRAAIALVRLMAFLAEILNEVLDLSLDTKPQARCEWASLALIKAFTDSSAH